MTHQQDNLHDKLCPLEWHAIKNLHLSTLPIPFPFKAISKQEAMMNQACSRTISAVSTLHLMTQNKGGLPQTCRSHISPALMPFSTVMDQVDPFAILHSRVPSSYSLCTMPLHMKNLRIIFSFFLPLLLLGPHLQHMEVPRLGVKSELQLPAYVIATAMPDLSRIWDLHHSSQQYRILNPLSKARDQIQVLMDTSWVRFHCSSTGTPRISE